MCHVLLRLPCIRLGTNDHPAVRGQRNKPKASYIVTTYLPMSVPQTEERPTMGSLSSGIILPAGIAGTK